MACVAPQDYIHSIIQIINMLVLQQLLRLLLHKMMRIPGALLI
jgi:hypothetical protein